MGPVKENILDIVRSATECFGNNPAYSCMGQKLSYAELDKLSDAFASWLHNDTSLSPGDRVAIQLPNVLQYPVAALGVLKAGMIIVNINPLYSPPEIQHQLQDSNAKILVVLANTAVKAAQIINETNVEQVIVTELADLHSPVKRGLINFTVKHIKKLIPPFFFPSQISFRKVLSKGRLLLPGYRHTLDSIVIPASSIAVLQYTGGTTGIAKAAMLSHANLVANMNQLKGVLIDECPVAGAIMVSPLPLYHIYAFTMTFLFAIHKGHHNILIPNPRDLKGMISTLRKYTLDGFVGINTLYNALASHPDVTKLDFSNLKISSSGGMALSVNTANRWEEITGCKILEGYGLTEASPLVSCNSYKDYKQGTVGKPAPDTEVMLVDINAQQVQPGESGEILVRGPQIMSGYWQSPEETSRALDADGWLHTGDIGVFDDEGFLRIVDRIKDMIIVSGFNVFPNEVEDYVCRHPDIREAAAIGISEDEIEKVKLYVVCGNPAIRDEDIIAHCREGLAAYKVPKLIEFRDSLPKSNVGKVLRRELRQELAELNEISNPQL